MSTSPFGVHYPLRNPLTVEVSQQVNQMKVLKEERSICAHSL